MASKLLAHTTLFIPLLVFPGQSTREHAITYKLLGNFGMPSRKATTGVGESLP